MSKFRQVGAGLFVLAVAMLYPHAAVASPDFAVNTESGHSFTLVDTPEATAALHEVDPWSRLKAAEANLLLCLSVASTDEDPCQDEIDDFNLATITLGFAAGVVTASCPWAGPLACAAAVVGYGLAAVAWEDAEQELEECRGQLPI